MIKSSGPLVPVGDPTPLVTELVTAQVSSPVSSTLVATLASDCEDASSAVCASGLPFVPETYVAGDGCTGDGMELQISPVNWLGDTAGSAGDGLDTDEGSAGEGSVSDDGSDGEARLPVPGSPTEDLLAPKSRSVSGSGLDSDSDFFDSDLDSGFVPALGPGSVPPPGSVGMAERPSSPAAQSKESRSLFSEPGSVDSSQVGFGLTKSQIWQLELLKDRLKNHIEVKDEDHSTFLKDMKEDFHWLNKVAREQGRMEVDEKDIRWIKMVVREDGRWEVDEEEDDRKVEWLNEVKEGLRLTVDWPSPKGKTITL
jgi:hypothetical protein